MNSSGPILTCHTKEFSKTDFSEAIDISGRCVLYWVWVVIGFESHSAGNSILLDFKSGGSGGDTILKFANSVTQFGNPEQRVGFGSGGILFPDGIYVIPNDATDDADIGGMTLLYERG